MGMAILHFTCWREGDMWLGRLARFPQFMTQGHTFEELRENLQDIFDDLASGCIYRTI